ncbi:hypothetical protein [Tepidibacillus marianensis]|uniref:hypothetical protein n=1 Tax=Tepidibacillus marianensis TaxID=3131995 RepID=UPI0030D2A075
MSTLKSVLATKIEEQRKRTTKLLVDSGNVKIGEVTIAQTIGGMRGVKGLVTDISYLDPFEGIRFRGIQFKKLWKGFQNQRVKNTHTLKVSIIYFLQEIFQHRNKLKK